MAGLYVSDVVVLVFCGDYGEEEEMEQLCYEQSACERYTHPNRARLIPKRCVLVRFPGFLAPHFARYSVPV